MIHSSTISPEKHVESKNTASEGGLLYPFSGHPPNSLQATKLHGQPQQDSAVSFTKVGRDVFRRSTQSSGSQDPEMPLSPASTTVKCCKVAPPHPPFPTVQPPAVDAPQTSTSSISPCTVMRAFPMHSAWLQPPGSTGHWADPRRARAAGALETMDRRGTNPSSTAGHLDAFPRSSRCFCSRCHHRKCHATTCTNMR